MKILISKLLSLLTILLLFTNCGTAQEGYSTKNKKAIKYFEEGQQAPQAQKDPRTGTMNFKAGLDLIEKAIEQDENFWEAYLIGAELAEYTGDHEKAVMYYQKAIDLNPKVTKSAFLYLAMNQQKIGKFAEAIKNYDIYISARSNNPELAKKALEAKENCEFALESMKNGTTFTPINIGAGINTKDPEYFPTITVDGRTILFTRLIDDARVAGTYKKQEDFYVSNLNDFGVWEKSIPMPVNVNTVNNEGAPTIGADGRSLIFVACPDASGTNYGEKRNGRGSCDMFFTKKLGARWSDPVNLPGKANTSLWESQPSLSSDGKTLYFIRRVNSRSEEPNSDIFVTKLQDNGEWGPAERLPMNINTPKQEESVLIHPDGKTLYFASKGHRGMGGSDLFISRMREDGTWGDPLNLGFPINTEADENSLMVSPDGEIGFFASNREGGYGDLDIYYFVMPMHLRPVKTLYFEGKVFDILTNAPIGGKFKLIDIKSGKEVVYSEADKETGEFTVSLPVDREYALTVDYPGYNFYSENFNMTNPDNLESVHKNIPMIPLTSDIPTVLENIFFDLAKSTLRPESFIELNKLKEFMESKPNIKIEIRGHTDTRGDDVANQTLSNDRAKAVYDYLINAGIDPSRMKYKGYGEEKPRVSDEAIEKLTSDKEKEKAHQSNRRTEYKIIK